MNLSHIIKQLVSVTCKATFMNNRQLFKTAVIRKKQKNKYVLILATLFINIFFLGSSALAEVVPSFSRLTPQMLDITAGPNQSGTNKDVSAVFGLPAGSILISYSQVDVRNKEGNLFFHLAGAANATEPAIWTVDYSEKRFFRAAHGKVLDGNKRDQFIATDGKGYSYSGNLLAGLSSSIDVNTYYIKNTTNTKIKNNVDFTWTSTGRDNTFNFSYNSTADSLVGKGSRYDVMLDVSNNYDYGDAPQSYGDAAHQQLSDNLYIGSKKPDIESGSSYSYNAVGDGDAHYANPEAGIDYGEDDGAPGEEWKPYIFPILKQSASSYSLDIKVSNDTGGLATLFAWIDFNKNGTFDANESTSVSVNDSIYDSPVTLTWNTIPNDIQIGTTFIRLRLTTDNSVTLTTPTNKAGNGEVEDYTIGIAQDIPSSSPNVTVLKDIDPRACDAVVFEDNFNDLPLGAYLGEHRNGSVAIRDWVVTGGGKSTYAKTIDLPVAEAASDGYIIEDYGTSVYLGNGSVRRVYPPIVNGLLLFDADNRLLNPLEAIELRDVADDNPLDIDSDKLNKSHWGPEPVTFSHTFLTEIGKVYRLYFKALPELGTPCNSNGVCGRTAGAIRIDTPSGSVHVKTPGITEAGMIKYAIEFTANTLSSTVSFVNYGHISVGSDGWCDLRREEWCTAGGTLERHANEVTIDDVVITTEKGSCDGCSINDTTTGVYSSSSVQINKSRLKANTRLYQAKFDVSKWQGLLTSSNLEIVNSNANGTLKNVKWDAKNKLPSAGKRKIFSYNPEAITANKGVAFKWGKLGDAQKSGLSAGLVRWVRGNQSKEKTTARPNGIFRDRGSNILGDIIHSSPVYANPYDDFGYGKLSGNEGGSYAVFLETKRNRVPMIYVGANDGMLHGFRASVGVEKFAFVPNEIIPKLIKISGLKYGCSAEDCLGHEALVDGQLAIGDVYLNSAWRSVLLGTLGEGGKGLFALNITTPMSFSSANVMWELSASQAANNATIYKDYLGESVPSPSIVRLHNNKWAAVIGNGPNSTSHKAALLLIDISNGQLIKVIDTGVGTEATPNGLSSPIPVDTNGDRITDTIYAGDLLGNLWKFDVSDISNTSNWSVAYTDANSSLPAPLFTACETDSCDRKQAITAKPQVGKHPSGGYMVYFGTGQYRDPRDNLVGTLDTETLYGIHDNGAQVTSLNDLIEQTVLKESSPVTDIKARVTSNHSVDYSSKKGWYLKLLGENSVAEGERVISQALLRGGRLILTTLVPPANCSWGGSSWLIELNALDGQPLKKPALDINNDRQFNFVDKVAYNNQSHVPSGIQNSLLGMVTHPPVIINHSAYTEGKYLSGSSGSVGLFRESSSRASGRQAWEQIR